MVNHDLRNDAKHVLQDYKKMLGYQIQEVILQRLIKQYPTHSCPEAVETKVKVLNLFYSTRINAVSLMTEHILSIKDIDERLYNGDVDLVQEIALLTFPDGKTRNNYSFATKYCAYHKPSLFPIYDRIVTDVFIKLFQDGNLPGYSHGKRDDDNNVYTTDLFREKLKQYDQYKKVYDCFMQAFRLTNYNYRKVDSYLWGAFKIAGGEYEIKKIAPIDMKNINQISIVR